MLDRLLTIEANFYAVTEWTPLATDSAKKEVVKRRRHANVFKSGFISCMKDESKVNQPDVLIDEGKQADIEALGDCCALWPTAKCSGICPSLSFSTTETARR